MSAYRCSFMPRDKGGHGRSGNKAKKAAARREAATQDALRTVSSSAAQAGAVPCLDDELEEAAATFAQTAMSEDEDEDDVAVAEAAVPPQPGPSSAERAPASAESGLRHRHSHLRSSCLSIAFRSSVPVGSVQYPRERGCR